MYCGLSTASEVFLISTTQLKQYFSGFFFLFTLFSDEPDVFRPKYSQTAILHNAHFQMVVIMSTYSIVIMIMTVYECKWNVYNVIVETGWLFLTLFKVEKS